MKFGCFILFLFFPLILFSQSFQKEWKLNSDSAGGTMITRMSILPNHSIALTGNVFESNINNPFIIFIMCIDSSGQLQWSKLFRDTANTVYLNNDTGYYKDYQSTFIFSDSTGITISGWMDSTGIVRVSHNWITSGVYHFPFLIKTDLQGNLLWEKKYLINFSYFNDYEIKRIMYFEDGNNGYLISPYIPNGLSSQYLLLTKINPNDGSIKSSKGFFLDIYNLNCAVYTSERIIFSFSGPAIGAIDTSGNWEWGFTINDSDLREFRDMKLSPDGNIINLMINGEFPRSRPSVGRINVSGNNFQCSQLNLPLYSRGRAVASDAMGNYYVTPDLFSIDSLGQSVWSSENYSGGTDILIDENKLYSCGGGGLLKTQAIAPDICENSKFPVNASLYSSISTNPLIPADSTIIVYDSGLSLIPSDTFPGELDYCTIVNTIEVEKPIVRLIPNPANAKFKVSVDFKKIKILSLDGNELSSMVKMEDKIINIESLSSGIYFVQIFFHDGSLITKKLLVNR